MKIMKSGPHQKRANVQCVENGNIVVNLQNQKVDTISGEGSKKVSDELKEGSAWRGLQCECPYCGGVMDIDEQSLISGTMCEDCDKEFLPKE